jgi:energy-converting hydrogenase Eha subunit A
MDRITIVCSPLAAYAFLYPFIISKRGARLDWTQKTALFALPVYGLMLVLYVVAGWYRTSIGVAMIVVLTGLLTAATLAVAAVGGRTKRAVGHRDDSRE